MKILFKTIVFSVLFVTFQSLAGGMYSTKYLLEKPIYYIDEQGKVGTCRYWAIYLGKQNCNIKKYFPGEGEITLNAEINFSLLSSLYIEGSGYSRKGKVKTDAEFAIAQDEITKNIPIDSIDFVFDNGKMALAVGSTTPSNFFLNVEGQNLVIPSMLIREYSYNKTYGELNHSKDIAIKAFSLTKSGIKKAQKEIAKK